MGSNPLFNSNKMKLGIIALNCSHGSTITDVENAWQMNWLDTKSVAQMADNAGFEVLLPVARWKGYGGVTNFNNKTFDTFTWASAISAITEYSCIFSTVHVPLVHPVAAAKQCATIDHVSNGRFALNIVCGWFRNEFEMFSAEWREHDVRYEYASEWLKLIQRLWSEDKEFTYKGRWFETKDAWSEPKPLQKPSVPIMNAGGSEAGKKFAASSADMSFVLLKDRDFEGGRKQVEHLKSMARAVNREIDVWVHAYVVCRDTEQEARDYLNYYVKERGDKTAVNNLLQIFGLNSQTLPSDVLDEYRFHFIAGHGGYPLIGTADQIVEEIEILIKMGVNGILISWVDYLGECRQWIEKVIPVMEQAGQREPKN